MGKLGVWGAVAALWLGAAGAASAACQLRPAGELNVVLDGNQPLVEVEGNGEKMWALLDSGASSSVLFQGAAQDLKLKVEPVGMRFQGVGGTQQAGMVRFKSFGFGGSRGENVRMLVVGGMRWTGKRRVVMLMGQDLLSQLDVEYDFKNSKVRLFKPVDCARSPLLYWADSWNEAPITSDSAVSKDLEVSVALNGRKATATLDTGASTSVVTRRAAARAGLDFSTMQDVGWSSGIGGRVKTHAAVFDSFKIGDEEIKRAKIRVSDLYGQSVTRSGRGLGSRANQDDDAMLLGFDWFRAHRVLVSNSQNKVYFTYAGGPVFQVVGPELEDHLDRGEGEEEATAAAEKPKAEAPKAEAAAPKP